MKVEFVPTEWKTLINGIQTDKYDVAMSGISMNVDRAKVAAFTVPYMEFGTVPVVRKKDAAKFKGWNDLDKPNVTIATTLGTVFDQQAKEYFKTAKRRQVEAPAVSYQEVLAGRAEACITSNVEAASLVQNLSGARDRAGGPGPQPPSGEPAGGPGRHGVAELPEPVDHDEA